MKTIENNINEQRSKVKEVQKELSKLNKTSNQINTSIKDLEEKIKTINAKSSSFFARLLLAISFGFYNIQKQQLKKASTLKIKIKKLLNDYKLNDDNQYNTRNKENKLQEELHLLENTFNKKLVLFKNELVAQQSKLLELSKRIYLNNVKINNESKSIEKIITNRKEYIEYIEEKNEIYEITSFIKAPDLWAKNKNSIFLKNEINIFEKYFDTIEDNPLTKNQREAVLVNQDNNLVVAGAGSGKTSVVVAKVGYLLKKGYATTDEILVLAFNKKAASEIFERIQEKIGIEADIRTFHSFGLSVIAESSAKPSLCKWATDSHEFSTLLKGTILSKMKDTVFFKNITKYFIEYFIPYKNEFDFKNSGEYYNYIKNYEIRTFNNEKVKSFEECEIANFLRLKNIEYEYEARYKYDTATSKKRQYEPDFYLPQYDIYIEHFGISRDYKTAPYVNNKEYVEGIYWKRELHKENNTNLIETYSYEKSEGKLTELLELKLQEYNVPMENITFEEAITIFKQKQGVLDRFTKLIISFLGHYKSNQFSIEDLEDRLERKDLRSYAFLNLFNRIFNAYEDNNKKCKCIDFDDMIVQACQLIESNKYKKSYKYIIVDEFQDISSGRSRLVKSLCKRYEDTILTVVGDDWQSINRFAGSDISIIKEFKKHFGKSELMFLDKTFRFDNNISKVASQFIMKNESQISKDISTIKTVTTPSIYIYKKGKDDADHIYKILNLLKNKSTIDKKQEIIFLARFNHLKPKNLSEVQATFSMFDISFMSVHASKGLGADYIILLGLDSGKFGFPSEIEDDPLLDIVMATPEKYPLAEERRLFYVALTRAKEKVFIISDANNSSIFTDELLKDNTDKEIFELGIKSEQIKKCSKCELGSLIKWENTDKTYFYGCSNYPLCNHTEEILLCKNCNIELNKTMTEGIAVCINKSCTYTISLCKICDGYMIKRKSKYGEFWSCSNYSPKPDGCKYKYNI